MKTFKQFLTEAKPKLTAYQKRCGYSKRIENKCDGKPVDGVCEKCGRHLTSKTNHLPNKTGSLGWHYIFGDGSTYDSHGFEDNL